MPSSTRAIEDITVSGALLVVIGGSVLSGALLYRCRDVGRRISGLSFLNLERNIVLPKPSSSTSLRSRFYVTVQTAFHNLPSRPSSSSNQICSGSRMSAQFSSFASIIAQSETMNPPQPPANSADLISLDEARDELSGPSQPQSQDESPQPLFQLVPMADFLKEQEIIAATKAALLPKKREKIPPPPPKPKVKKDIDPLELEAEAQAVKECGYENWIGKLQSESKLFSYPHNLLLKVTQSDELLLMQK